jgi:hypothetical protein
MKKWMSCLIVLVGFSFFSSMASAQKFSVGAGLGYVSVLGFSGGLSVNAHVNASDLISFGSGLSLGATAGVDVLLGGSAAVFNVAVAPMIQYTLDSVPANFYFGVGADFITAGTVSNLSVGIIVGGEYYFNESLGAFVRYQTAFLGNSVITIPVSFISLGVKFAF